MTPRVLSTSTITGTKVYNRQGEHLGDIKDIMLNANSGEVAYCVLSFGGFLGLGDKYFAIPYEAFTVDQKDEKFILNVDKEQLKDAPGFDKNNWPKSSDTSFLDRVYNHYGYEQNWRTRTRTTNKTATYA